MYLIVNHKSKHCYTPEKSFYLNFRYDNKDADIRNLETRVDLVEDMINHSLEF